MEETDQMVYSGGCMCAPRLGTVLAMHFREVVITLFIVSAIARGKIGDPTIMLAHNAVEVEAATRMMGVHGRCFSMENVYWCQVYFKHDNLVVIPQTGWGRSTLRKAEAAVRARCTDA